MCLNLRSVHGSEISSSWTIKGTVLPSLHITVSISINSYYSQLISKLYAFLYIYIYKYILVDTESFCAILVQNMFLKTDSSSQASQCFLPLPPHKRKHYYSQDQTVSFLTVFESCVSLRWSYHHGAVVLLNCPFM